MNERSTGAEAVDGIGSYTNPAHREYQKWIHDPGWRDAMVPVRRVDLWALYGSVFHTLYSRYCQTEDEWDECADRLRSALYGPAIVPASPVRADREAVRAEALGCRLFTDDQLRAWWADAARDSDEPFENRLARFANLAVLDAIRATPEPERAGEAS